MAVVDSQGRLFGKVNILDIGAVLVILMVIIGVLLPSMSGIAQVGVKPVEIDVVVRGLWSNTLLKQGDTPNIIIRNQPHGKVEITAIKELPRNVPVPQPDGSVKALPDPRPEAGFTRDYFITLRGKASITDDGPVVGNQKVKAGTKIELEGLNYNFVDLGVVDVRIKE